MPVQSRGAGRQVTEVRDVIIIGSGPAGYTAALYAARGKLNPLLFEGSVTSGGALMNTTEVENFPGFADGVLGPELMDSIRKQAERFGAELVPEDVTEVDLTATPKVVKVGEDTYLARTVIIATGSRYRELGAPGEKRLSGHGVSWCATCDGFFFRESEIAVIGGGDSALEEATFLTRFAKSVTIVHRRDSLRASKIMQDRATSNPKIKFAWGQGGEEVLGEDRVLGLRCGTLRLARRASCRSPGCSWPSATTPQRALHRATAGRRGGLPLVDHPSSRTAIDGVFGAGAVVHHISRPGDPAAGTGCAAALDAERWLADQRVLDPHRPRRPPARVIQGRKSWNRGLQPSLPTDASFEADVLKSDKPVIVDYWAEWCGPCRQVSPILEEIASEHDEIQIIDSCRQQVVAVQFMNVPTMSVFKGGEVVKEIVGAKPKSALLRDLAEFLSE